MIDFDGETIELNAERIDLNGGTIDLDAEGIDLNGETIEVNDVAVDVNADPIDLNRFPIAGNAIAIDLNAVRVEPNANAIDRIRFRLAGERANLHRVQPALILIDVQRAIDDPSWGSDRNNPEMEANIAALLARWRERKWPIFHVRHASREANSTYRPGQPGFAFKPEAAPIDGERVIEKHVNSAFIGTTLEAELRDAGIVQLFIAGVITNNSVEATVRMAGNLGFDTSVLSDATATFGRHDFDGRWRTSAEVHAMSLANMSGEYATVVTTAEVLAGASQFGDAGRMPADRPAGSRRSEVRRGAGPPPPPTRRPRGGGRR